MSKKEKVLLGVAIATGISTLNAVTSVSADTVTTSTATDNSSVEVVQKLSKHLIRQITMLKLLRINYLRRKI